jgi:cob(I)alamin adenosyltransferase
LSQLEQQEKLLIKNVEISESFVNPGGTRLAATIDIARTVCRRSERRLVTCLRSSRPEQPPGGVSQRYLNLLSDYLFILTRYYETG